MKHELQKELEYYIKYNENYMLHALQAAVENGVDLRTLPKKLSTKLLELDNFEAFRMSAIRGHVDTCRYLAELAEKTGGKAMAKRMLEAYDFYAFRYAAGGGHADTCRYLLELAERTGGKEMVGRMLEADKFGAFREAAGRSRVDTCRYLAELAEKSGGKAMVGRMLEAKDFYAFREAARHGDVDTCRYLAELAEKTGEKTMVGRMLEADDFNAFRRTAQYVGHVDTCRYLLELAERNGGKEMVGRMLEADDFYAFRRLTSNHHIESAYFLAAQRQAPEGLRRLAAEKYANSGFPVTMPDPKDLGKPGHTYSFGAALNVTGKLERITRDLPVTRVDIKKILANHKSPRGTTLVRGEEINWPVLSEMTDHISHTKADEIADTIWEVAKYAALYLLADEYKNQLSSLQKLDEEQLEKAIDHHRDKVITYFLEHNSLPQMAVLSDQWHRFRSGRLKASQDGSTLRDFAEAGGWHAVIPGKEIAVTAPGLEGYSIVNLTDANELTDEGNALKHCVSGYVDECKNGFQVFSIRKNGEPQTTLGCEVKNGALIFSQHQGKNNCNPNVEEKAVEKWFMDGVRKGTIKLNLGQIGEIPVTTQRSAFENAVGIEIKNLTPQRLQSNLNLITEFGKGWGDRAANTFPFGRENKGATLEKFAKNIEGTRTAAIGVA